MPTTPATISPLVRAALLCVALGYSAVIPAASALGAEPQKAEPSRSQHGHQAARPAIAPPPPPAPPAPAPRPTGPLDSEAALVAHPQTSLVEAVTRAGPRLVAVGIDGLIMLSDDEGLSWRQVQPPVQATLTAVGFSDDNTGWAIGHYGVVLRTDDAGEDWTLVMDGPRAAQITLDSALADNQSDANRERAIDAARRLGSSNPSRPFLLLQTDGSDTLRTIGSERMALETQDGGKHWHPWSAAIDDPDGLPLLGMAERDGVMVVDGAHGILLAGRPEDGLQRIASPTEASLFGALDAGRFGIVIYGQQGNAFAGTLAQPAASTKASAWHQIDVPTQNAFTAGLLKRNGAVLLGDSGGMTWTLTGKPDNPHLEAGPAKAPFPILSMAETADGGLILAGAGGTLRIEPPAPPAPPPAQTPAPTPAPAPAPASAPGPPVASPTPAPSAAPKTVPAPGAGGSPH